MDFKPVIVRRNIALPAAHIAGRSVSDSRFAP
jgi:hypothetical protein